MVLRRLAALLEVTPDGLEHVLEALRLSNAQGDYLRAITLGYEDLSIYMDYKDMRQLVYRKGNDIARSMILLSAAKVGEEGDLRNLSDIATSFRPPRFPLQGQDALAIGMNPGPEVGEALAAIEDWWVESDFMPGRTACLDKLKQDFAPRS
jgi:poly(A) polymerase